MVIPALNYNYSHHIIQMIYYTLTLVRDEMKEGARGLTRFNWLQLHLVYTFIQASFSIN